MAKNNSSTKPSDMKPEDYAVSVCVDKQKFDSKVLADKVREGMLRRKRGMGRCKLDSYKCPLCKMWHVGTTARSHKRH